MFLNAKCYVARNINIYWRRLYPGRGVLEGSEHISCMFSLLLFVVRLWRLSAIQTTVVRRKDGLN